MTASKRNMRDFENEESFPFKILKDNSISSEDLDVKIIVYGPIYNYQNNKNRLWKATLTLFKKDGTAIDIKKKYINEFDSFEDGDYVEIRKITYYLGENPKIQNALSDIVNVGKNIGKKNETNILQQSLIIGRSYYLKKVNAGFSLELNDRGQNHYPFCMALGDFDKHYKKISYPVIIQPKLDGVRAIISLKDMKMISRRHKIINGFDFIIDEFKTFKSYENIFVDGELYVHGIPLQEISGIVRTEDLDKKMMLKYHIFDIFNTDDPEMILSERLKIIEKFKHFDHSEIVKSTKCKNEDEINELMKVYVKDNYEGIVYKNINRPYEFNFDKEKRSMYNLKRKSVFDSEFKVIDYDLDKNDHVIFILETDDGNTFKSVPMWTLEKRKAFTKKTFIKDYLNKMATVRYDDLSIDKIPVRSRFICIRDYE